MGSNRKKLDKSVDPTPALTAKFICCRCGRAFSRQKGFFPVSHSPLYRGSGYLPFCNDCVDEMFEDYVSKLNDPRKAMRRMCQKMDLYYNDSIYDMVEKTAGIRSQVRSYVGKTNIIRYLDKTYDDTIKEDGMVGLKERDVIQVPSEDTESEEKIEVPQEVIDFWGPGQTPEMYRDLEQRRQYWESRLPDGTNIDMGTEILIRQGCNLELDINRNRLAGKSIEKSVTALNTIVGSLNLKPEQQKDAGDTEAERTPMGVWIARWEEKRPVPEPDPELQDHDGVVRYVTTWFLGHLCKMLGIRNTYCKLYEDAMEEKKVELNLDEEIEVDEDLFNDIFGNTAGDAK